MIRQRAAVPPPGRRMLAPVTYYIPIAGTWGYDSASWAYDDESPWASMMRTAGFTPIRATDGRPFRWTTQLDGLKFWGKRYDWEAGADALAYFLEPVPYEHRNLIAHSHGGQVALFLAASKVPIRTLTTIGTPRRYDVPAESAKPFIRFWQHIYDQQRDWTAWWGQVGDKHWSNDRRFLIPGVVNHGLPDISHSKVLNDPTCFRFWWEDGWQDAIKTAGGVPDAA